MSSFEDAWKLVKEDDDKSKKGENDCSKCGKYIHFQDEPHWSASECSDCWTQKGENDCSKCGKYIHFQDEPHWSASECSDCWTPDKKVMNYSDSVDRIRNKTWEKGMGEISIPMRDRDNPNPHPLDGMLDDSFISANDAYTLWDEGYEPDYNPVIEAAKSVLEAMGYKVSPPPSEEADSAAAMRSAKIGRGTASFDDLMADRDKAIEDGKDLREHYRS